MIRTISSAVTFVHKFIGSVFAVGLAVPLIVATVFVGLNGGGSLTLVLSVFSILATYQAWQCIRLKRIEIDGDYLIISNFVKSDRVHVSDVDRITENSLATLHPVWLHFKRPTVFGTRIVFMPPMRLTRRWFLSHPVVGELRKLQEECEDEEGQIPQ